MATPKPPSSGAARRHASKLSTSRASPSWTFLTNHAHVLLCLARDPQTRMREIAHLVGITERAVQRIIADLEDAGHLVRVRQGRRNRYEIRDDLPLRHPVEGHVQVSALLNFVTRQCQRSR